MNGKKELSTQPKTLETWRQDRDRKVSEFKKCASDVEYFIENYCHYINPKKPIGNRVGLMKLWPHQKRLIRELIKYLDIFSEKSREMGISWGIMAFQLHQALFTDYFSSLNISRAEREVQDPGCTYHSLMGRIKFMHNLLPPFLRLRVNCPFLTFHVLATNSIIRGESANINAGRDTQYKFIFVDEAAHIKVFSTMWKALRNASDSIMVNSTPPDDPQDNKYVELKNMTGPNFKLMRFHWSEHPDKDQNWFKKKTATMTEEEIRQELDIKYDSKKVERSYSEWDDDIHRNKHKFYLNSKYPLILGFDFGLEAEVILFLQQDKDKRLFLLHAYQEANLLTEAHVKNLLKILGKLGYRRKLSEIKAYGDVYSGRRKERTSGKSIVEQYSTFTGGALSIQMHHTPFDEKRRCIKKLLKDKINGLPKFQASVSCEHFSKCMANVKMNRQGMDHTDNWTTHKVNAFEYVVHHLYPLIKGESINISISSDGNIEYNDKNATKNITMGGISIFGGTTLRSILDRHRIPRRRIM